MNAQQPIGVFDSGIGGLTVLKALMARLPHESFLYLGDTARLPYGTKTAGTVERYALQAVDELTRRGVKALVIACNTASAAALPALKAAHPELPIIGVIEPGAAAAVAASESGRIAVLATEGTVRGGAYQREILKLAPQASVTSIPATLFVALAEEGWTDDEVATATAHRYLAPLLADPAQAPDVLVLGCTHFPPLAAVIQREAGEGIRIVDSAMTTAGALASLLSTRGLAADNVAAPAAAVVAGDAADHARAGDAACRFLVTDGEERFARVGPLFLGQPIASRRVERVDL